MASGTEIGGEQNRWVGNRTSWTAILYWHLNSKNVKQNNLNRDKRKQSETVRAKQKLFEPSETIWTKQNKKIFLLSQVLIITAHGPNTPMQVCKVLIITARGPNTPMLMYIHEKMSVTKICLPVGFIAGLFPVCAGMQLDSLLR